MGTDVSVHRAAACGRRTLRSENSRTALQRAAKAADCTGGAGSRRRRHRAAATAGLHSSPRRSLALRDSACTAPQADARTAGLEASAQGSGRQQPHRRPDQDGGLVLAEGNSCTLHCDRQSVPTAMRLPARVITAVLTHTQCQGYGGYCAAVSEHPPRGMPLWRSAQHRDRPQRSVLHRTEACEPPCWSATHQIRKWIHSNSQCVAHFMRDSAWQQWHHQRICGQATLSWSWSYTRARGAYEVAHLRARCALHQQLTSTSCRKSIRAYAPPISARA